MDALAITNYVLAVSGMVATALTIASMLFGKSGGMVMSLLVKPASMGKDGLSGWVGPLVTVGGWLGMVLGSHQDLTFSVFSDLSLFFGALLLTAFLFSNVASSWHTKIGCHIASGVAIWAVLGQIGATWYIPRDAQRVVSQKSNWRESVLHGSHVCRKEKEPFLTPTRDNR